MEFPTKEAIAGTVALIVACLGFVQWKRGKRSGRFIEDREAAYNEVWQSLESAHLLIRSGSFDLTSFDEAVKNANTLLIRHGLHIAEADKQEAAGYIAALRKLGPLVSQASPHTKHEMEITGEQLALSGDLLAAYSEHQAARQRLMDRFRRAIGSGQI